MVKNVKMELFFKNVVLIVMTTNWKKNLIILLKTLMFFWDITVYSK